MNTKLRVGNLAATTTGKELEDWFSPHGNVAEVNLPVERGSGKTRAYGIVTMATPQGAQAAILALNGKALAGRALTVSAHVCERMAALGSVGSAVCNAPANDTPQVARLPEAFEPRKSVFRRLAGLWPRRTRATRL